VCTNGVVSFGSSSLSPDPGSLLRSRVVPVVAVNWLKFTTYSIYYNKDRVYYRTTSSGRQNCFFDDIIYWAPALSYLVGVFLSFNLVTV